MFRPLSLFLIVFLAACSQTTVLVRPSPPVPEVWPLENTGVGKVDAAKTHWRAFFTDPRLQALISASLQHNRDLRIAAARVAEARAQYGIARADRLPSLTFGSDSNASVLSSTYELDFWGRVKSLTESARVSFLATEEARRAVHLSLISDVASTYFGLIQLDESIALAQVTVDLRTQSLQLIREGRDLGGSQEYDVQQAYSLLQVARSNLAASQHQRALTSNKLDFLVGKTNEPLPPGRSLDEQSLDADIAPGLPSEVLLLRPDVMAAEQRLRAAHANIDVARTAFFPKIQLSAGFGVASQALTSLAGSAGAWYLVPVLSAMPLFDNGRTASGVDAAEARKAIAVAEYERTIQAAFREVADSLSARASLTSQFRAALASSNAQETRLHITKARHNAGLVSYLEVLDGERELLAAQQTATQLRRAQLESAAQLYKALGGGDQGERGA
jgi:multidrug efflux system outer membrane protein